MTEKAKPFAASVAAHAANRRPGFQSWFDKLPPEAQKELSAVRELYHAGKFGDLTLSAMALGIMRAASERGWATGKEQRVVAWLRKSR